MQDKDDTANYYYQIGRDMYFRENGQGNSHERGWQFLNKACEDGHVEAMYLIGYTAYVNPFSEQLTIRDKNGNKSVLTKAQGWDMICEAAKKGSVQAKYFMDRVYGKEFFAKAEACGEQPAETSGGATGPLKDFDGKRIQIRREGVLTPVDAVLEYKDGVNILTFSLNLKFLYIDEFAEKPVFEDAVRAGIKAWEGTYTVFGGQKVRLRINLTEEDRLLDNVVFIPCTETLKDALRDVADATENIGLLKKKHHQLEHFIGAMVGPVKWTVHSRKAVVIRPANGNLSDWETVMNIVRHEFGHVLGIGDLYKDHGQGFDGILPGKYYDLDPFYVAEGKYDLIMCDINGKISDNDIEMVILAFSENRMQLYQAAQRGDVISKAIGHGN